MTPEEIFSHLSRLSSRALLAYHAGDKHTHARLLAIIEMLEHELTKKLKYNDYQNPPPLPSRRRG